MGEKTAAQKKAQQKYMEKFSVARVRMDHKRYERVQAHAEAQGESVSAFINRAIDQVMAQERGKGPTEDAPNPLVDGVVSTPSELERTQEIAHNGATTKGE